MTTTSRIIPKALCVFQHAGRVLVCFSTDAAKGQRYARPPGGTIEFGEHAGEAVEREVQEELGACIADLTLVGVLENIFTLEGEPRHEILFVFTAGFADPSVYATTRVPMREPGWEGDAEWVPLERFVSGDVPLYPTGLLPLLERAHRERLSSGFPPPHSVPEHVQRAETSHVRHRAADGPTQHGGQMRNQGGDRGKAPNRTGTQPRKRVDAPAPKPGRKSVKGGAAKGVGRGKHAAELAAGAKTSQTRTAGPKKTPRGTTTRSGDR